MDKIGRLRALEKAVELVAKANVPELEPFGGEVSAKDGDVVADCYYNAAHENDAEDVSRAIAAAVNFIREHGSALIAELGQEVGVVDFPPELKDRVDRLQERAAQNAASPAHTSEARELTDAMVEAALDAQPFTADNVSHRVWQLVSQALTDEERRTMMRAALDAAMRQEGGTP